MRSRSQGREPKPKSPSFLNAAPSCRLERFCDATNCAAAAACLFHAPRSTCTYGAVALTRHRRQAGNGGSETGIALVEEDESHRIMLSTAEIRRSRLTVRRWCWLDEMHPGTRCNMYGSVKTRCQHGRRSAFDCVGAGRRIRSDTHITAGIGRQKELTGATPDAQQLSSSSYRAKARRPY